MQFVNGPLPDIIHHSLGSGSKSGEAQEKTYFKTFLRSNLWPIVQHKNFGGQSLNIENLLLRLNVLAFGCSLLKTYPKQECGVQTYKWQPFGVVILKKSKRPFMHSIYIRTVSSQQLLSTLLIQKLCIQTSTPDQPGRK